MISPKLLAAYSGEAQAAIDAIVELTFAADDVVADTYPEPGDRLDALTVLFHAIRYQSSNITAYARVVGAEAERDASPAHADFYRAILRQELYKLSKEWEGF